jgi:hypothetical protein
MDGPHNAEPRDHNFERLVKSQRLRAGISAALGATPIDEARLRLDVWKFVGGERHDGASAGRVIVSLTELVDANIDLPLPIRHALLRKVILWCVEAYFGHLDGDVVGRDTVAFADPPVFASER